MTITKDELRKRLDGLESRRQKAKDGANEIFARAQGDHDESREGAGDNDWTRDLTADEHREVAEYQADALSAQKEIDAIRSQLQLSDTEDRGRVHTTPVGTPEGGNEERATRYQNAFNMYLRRGSSDLDAEERQLLREGARELTPEERALVAGTDASGGYTIPEGFIDQVDVAMKKHNWMDDAGVTVLPTTTGADLPMPTMDDTAQMGEQLDENTAATEQDFDFGVTTLKAFLFSSQMVPISRVLLQDSGVNVRDVVTKALGERLGRIFSLRGTTGNGTSQPEGIVTAAAAGVTTVSETAITYDEIINLEHEVDPAYRMGAKFMYHDTTSRQLRKLKDGDGRPLWQPSLQAGVAPTLNGRPFVINQNMAEIAESNDVMLFGDYSTYWWRTALAPVLLDIDDSLRTKFMRGFVMFGRNDGRHMIGRGKSIKKLTMKAAA
jgi:HK97 family phage major capsid protein